LIYVGYTAAGPLISYIQSGGSSGTVTSWTPDESGVGGSENNGSEPSSADTSLEITTQPREASSIGTYLISRNALKSKDALNSALDSAKNSGFGIVLIPLKDDSGAILYKSQIDYIANVKELVTGTLSAKDIADAVKAKGLVPKAVIPTLLDKISPDYVNDTGYYFADSPDISWYDKAPDNGGKRWVDPYRAGTKKYYSDMVKELKTAGFEEIALSELRYPDLHDSDEPRLGSKFFTADRYKGLSELYQGCYNASDKKAAVSVNIKDVLDGKGQSFYRTAEILTDKSFSGKIFLTVNLADFGETLELAQGNPLTLPKDAAKKAEALIGKASEYIGTNVTVVPVINGAGMSMEDLVKCYKEITP
ncbi:MAG: putative glycoside hydrolase, partial [Ruminiclostridium sp.]|nr:putative glycoside hydrolase [Ruminiclostridium sp.]